jgi:hypothetical protein
LKGSYRDMQDGVRKVDSVSIPSKHQSTLNAMYHGEKMGSTFSSHFVLGKQNCQPAACLRAHAAQIRSAMMEYEHIVCDAIVLAPRTASFKVKTGSTLSAGEPKPWLHVTMLHKHLKPAVR